LTRGYSKHQTRFMICRWRYHRKRLFSPEGGPSPFKAKSFFFLWALPPPSAETFRLVFFFLNRWHGLMSPIPLRSTAIFTPPYFPLRSSRAGVLCIPHGMTPFAPFDGRFTIARRPRDSHARYFRVLHSISSLGPASFSFSRLDFSCLAPSIHKPGIVPFRLPRNGAIHRLWITF